MGRAVVLGYWAGIARIGRRIRLLAGRLCHYAVAEAKQGSAVTDRTEKPEDASATSPLRSLSPLGVARPSAHAVEPPLPFRDAEVKERLPHRPWWQRVFGRAAVASAGFTAIAVPGAAQASTVLMQVVTTPVADVVTTQQSDVDQVQAVLDWLDAHEHQAGQDQAWPGVFEAVLSHVAEKAADLAIDACMMLAARGIWRAAKRRSGRPHEAENLRAAAEAVALQDEWLSAALGAPMARAGRLVPSDADFLAAGRRYVAAMGERLKPSICAEKGFARGLAGDATKELGNHLRKSLFKGDVSGGLALAVSALAASIAKVGLENFCAGTPAA